MDRPRMRVHVDLPVESEMTGRERQRRHQFAICNACPRRNWRSRQSIRRLHGRGDKFCFSTLPQAFSPSAPKRENAFRFRRTLEQIAILLLAEVSKNWTTRAVEINTPLAAMRGASLARPVVFAPILRAGLGLLEGMLRVMPDAEVGHIGLYRDEVTLRP